MATNQLDPRDFTAAKPFDTLEAYREAVSLLQGAAEAYYSGTEVLVDDATYDQELARVKATEQAQPSWVVEHDLHAVSGGQGGGDVAHSSPMLSLDNLFDQEGLEAWVSRLSGLLGNTPTLVVEPKLDGVAMALRYVNGRLVQAVTRGDGSTGEDVTNQVRGARGVPDAVSAEACERIAGSKTFEVRGELYFAHDDFAEANKARVASGKAAFANPRNAAAGTVRNQSGPVGTLSFAAYDLLDARGERFGSHLVNMHELHEAGFSTARRAVGLPDEAASDASAASAVWGQIENLGKRRGDLGFDIDGAVIKADGFDDRQKAGATGRAPRWAIAYKYPADMRLTTLKEIIVDVGRTGRCTPVGILEPVQVGGVTVERATLHNASDLEKRNVRPGDKVWVRRAGEVIPEIVGPKLDERPQDSQPWEMPTSCPRCGAELDRSQLVWRCVNRTCGTGEQIEYFASRKAMDIEGLGPTLVAQLIERDLVRDPADLFELTLEDLAGLDRMGEQSGRNVLAQIDASRSKPLHRLLCGLGIRGTGSSLCKRIAKAFETMEAIQAASAEELAQVDLVGPIKAELIREELDSLSDLIARLVQAGCTTVEPASETNTQGPLAGKKVCVTGSVPGLTRDGAKEAVERLGGISVSSVSAKCDLLVAGDKAGSKLRKAQELGVEVMDAEGFLALLEG